MDRAFGVYDLRTVRDMSVFADDPDAMAELDDVLQNVGHLSEPLLLRPQGPSEWNPDCPEAAWWPKYDPSPPGIIYDPCHKSAINTINKHYAPLSFAVVIRYTNVDLKMERFHGSSQHSMILSIIPEQ